MHTWHVMLLIAVMFNIAQWFAPLPIALLLFVPVLLFCGLALRAVRGETAAPRPNPNDDLPYRS